MEAVLTEPVLEARALNKRFGAVIASDQVSFVLHSGEIHALIGPNGAGKSTLLKQLAGETASDSGEVFLSGQSLQGLDSVHRAKAGIARSFQISSIIPALTCEQNVLLSVEARERRIFRFFRPALGDLSALEAASDYLHRVGLSGREGVIAAELSHGERRRLELAMVLALKPAVFLLDEPMAGLGPEGTGEIRSLLQDLRKEAPMLLVEHDMDAVFALADRISVLVYGKVIASGTPNEIKSNSSVREAYLGDDI